MVPLAQFPTRIEMTVDLERWQTLSREGLPLASGQVSETTLELARLWARLPHETVVTLKRIGDIQLRPDAVAMVDDLDRVPIDDLAWFRLTRTTEQAWLGLAFGVCHGLIRAVLGGAAPLLIRPLGSAERGLMSSILVSALRSLGLAHRMTLASGEARPSWQGRQVLLEGAIRGGAEIDGRAFFVGPWSWLADGLGQVVTSTDDTAVEGVLELGRTVVSAAELGAAKPGDAIVFDGIPGLAPGVTWPVNLLVGRSWASARLDPDSKLALSGPWLQMEGDDARGSQDESTRWKTAAPARPEPRNLAGDMVEIVAELGRISLRGDELAGLAQGGSLMLGPRPAGPINLRVGDRPWATGELVKLGEQLGVRIVLVNG
jgi:type III secretion system YscQ/HrcQ family protein